MNTPIRERAAASASGYPLISKERMQKLDLLKHLVDNLANVVVVCGPDGIGKTKLLKMFAEDYAAPSAIFSWLNGSSGLHFDQIKESLSSKIADVLPELKTQPLSVALERIHSRGLSVVQIVDDAGLSVPGMIGKIIEYANAHPALKVIFALSHDDLYIKCGTDPMVEDCYQIEIPPLTQQQCEDYLEYLSTLPNPRIDFITINEERAAGVFSETHGIPGKILAYLPEPKVQKAVDYTKPALFGAVGVLVLAVAGVQWWSNHRSDAGIAKAPSAMQEAVDPVKPEATPPATNTAAVNPGSTDAGNAVSSSVEPAIMESGQASSPGQNQVPENKPEAAAPPAPTTGNQPVLLTAANDQNNPGIIAPPASKPIETDDTESWISAQPPENSTMQLMALTNEQDIIAVMERYPELKPDMRYVKTKTKRGGDRYLLFYGAFSDLGQLQAQRQGLPRELKQAWVRQFADIQKQLNPEPAAPAITTTP